VFKLPKLEIETVNLEIENVKLEIENVKLESKIAKFYIKFEMEIPNGEFVKLEIQKLITKIGNSNEKIKR